MAFTPRTFPEILNDMVAYVQTRTPLSDFAPGSMIRTILESAALEDDEQYYQMVQLLDMFSINSATGSDLDRRLADYNIFRFRAKSSSGKVQFADNGVKTSQVAIDALAGATAFTVADSSPFPIAGFPYTVRVGEGTAQVQDVDVTANNTSSGLLTLAATTPLTDDLSVGNTCTLVTGAVSRVVAAGTSVESPATAIAPSKSFTTTEAASIVGGNILSNLVRISAVSAGILGNTGANTITRFTGGAPFTGASVLNPASVEGGLEAESDKDFRDRGLDQLQSLSRGTPLAVKNSSIGVTDTETGQRVRTANLVEDFVNNLVLVYVDDGTGLTADISETGSSSLDGALAGAETEIVVDDGSSFPSIGTVLIEAGGGAAELLTYESKDNNTLKLTSGTTVANAHSDGVIVSAVDVATASSEPSQRRFKLQNFPLVFGTERIFSKTLLGAWTLLTAGTDYLLNHGTGELQIIDAGGLLAGTQLVAHYDYYTNLVSLVQKILEGDPDDPINYPGVKATGVFIRVLPANPFRVTVKATIKAEPGFLEEDLRAPVRRAIEDYINNAKIGENIILTKITDAAHDTPGLRDIIITSPASNPVVLEDQVPVAQDISGTSIVTIT